MGAVSIFFNVMDLEYLWDVESKWGANLKTKTAEAGSCI